MRFNHIALGTLFVLAASTAHAQNLVINPGFETGDFTGYTVNAGATGVATAGGPGGYTPFEGTHYAFLGAVGGLGTISQDIATTPGQDYLVSYYLASNGTTPNEFTASFGGVSLFDQTNIAPQPYTLYSFTVTATAATSTLRFGERDDPNYLALDNVSVTAVNAVPEPGSIALLAGMGLSGAGFLARRRKNARHTA